VNDPTKAETEKRKSRSKKKTGKDERESSLGDMGGGGASPLVELVGKKKRSRIPQGEKAYHSVFGAMLNVGAGLWGQSNACSLGRMRFVESKSSKRVKERESDSAQ